MSAALATGKEPAALWTASMADHGIVLPLPERTPFLSRQPTGRSKDPKRTMENKVYERLLFTDFEIVQRGLVENDTNLVRLKLKPGPAVYHFEANTIANQSVYACLWCSYGTRGLSALKKHVDTAATHRQEMAKYGVVVPASPQGLVPHREPTPLQNDGNGPSGLGGSCSVNTTDPNVDAMSYYGSTGYEQGENPQDTATSPGEFSKFLQTFCDEQPPKGIMLDRTRAHRRLEYNDTGFDLNIPPQTPVVNPLGASAIQQQQYNGAHAEYVPPEVCYGGMEMSWDCLLKKIWVDAEVISSVREAFVVSG